PCASTLLLGLADLHLSPPGLEGALPELVPWLDARGATIERRSRAGRLLLVPGPGGHRALRQVVGRVDESDVGERLGEVAELVAAGRAERLGQQGAAGNRKTT